MRLTAGYSLQWLWKRRWAGGGIGLLLCSGLLLVAGPIAAQEEEFPPNPLELTEPDPLLPTLVIDRPLSPQEQGVLSAGLDELRQQAAAKFRQGDLPGAFELWIRELRLRRYLGVEEEVAALSRVGEVAWQESQTTEVRLITGRLREIEQQLQTETPLNYDLLLEIAQAYQNMRAYNEAVALYEQLLEETRQRPNPQRQQQILTALGELHLIWFDYDRAAPVFEELRSLAQAQDNRNREIEALQQLAFIYQENNQPQEAIVAQQQLVEVYQSTQEFTQIPPIKLAIGDSYTALNRPDRAAPSYQEAFAVARSTQQYGYASDALQRLATLYQSLDRPEDALVVYQLLLDVKAQSYDTLGIMETYDQIGQVYLSQGQAGRALNAFRQGLQLAQQLNYKVDYFTTQIEQARQGATPEAAN